jgi:hydrogenase maturation protein HypF
VICFVKKNQMILSEHIGDMADVSVYRHYVDSVTHLAQLFEVKPKIVVCDLHPGYLSSQYAQTLKNVELIMAQHHWAHIASVLAENELDEKVIGLECDGTGYGTDGTIWGCECLIADLEGFTRFGHLKYYPLPGGDAASKYAIRSIMGLLTQAYGENFNIDEFGWLLDKIERNRQKQFLILEQISKGINTVQTSSLGRVFDAVAAMAGIGSRNEFEAQLPMVLEAAIKEGIEEAYDFKIDTDNKPVLTDLNQMFRQIVDDVKNETDVSIISSKFHNTVADALLETAKCARNDTDLNKVALSGGVFCNRYLTNRLIKSLKKAGFDVLFNRLVPSNDGGISLGQAAIALKRIAAKKIAE